MLVVNFFGAPAAGKSTMASELFVKLKSAQYEAELCSEYAKSLVWGGRKKTLEDGVYIFAKQNSILNNLLTHKELEVAVTDSPILLPLIYLNENYFKTFPALALEIFNSYDNLNFYMPPRERYSSVGRIQSEEEAKAIDRKISFMLLEYGIPVIPLSQGGTVNDVFPEVCARLDSYRQNLP